MPALELEAKVLDRLNEIKITLCLPPYDLNSVISGFMVEDMDFSGSSEFENVIGGKYINSLNSFNDKLDTAQFVAGIVFK